MTAPDEDYGDDEPQQPQYVPLQPIRSPPSSPPSSLGVRVASFRQDSSVSRRGDESDDLDLNFSDRYLFSAAEGEDPSVTASRLGDFALASVTRNMSSDVQPEALNAMMNRVTNTRSIARINALITRLMRSINCSHTALRDLLMPLFPQHPSDDNLILFRLNMILGGRGIHRQSRHRQTVRYSNNFIDFVRPINCASARDIRKVHTLLKKLRTNVMERIRRRTRRTSGGNKNKTMKRKQ